jgi:hypothetical protein
MDSELSYRVRWIVAPYDPQRAGVYGTTTHAGNSPAGAAIASAESVMDVLADDQREAQMYILSVFGAESDCNLLSGEDLRKALRRHDRILPFEVVYRPLC